MKCAECLEQVADYMYGGTMCCKACLVKLKTPKPAVKPRGRRAKKD